MPELQIYLAVGYIVSGPLVAVIMLKVGKVPMARHWDMFLLLVGLWLPLLMTIIFFFALALFMTAGKWLVALASACRRRSHT